MNTCVICKNTAEEGTYKGIDCCFDCYVSGKAEVLDSAPGWVLFACGWLKDHPMHHRVALALYSIEPRELWQSSMFPPSSPPSEEVQQRIKAEALKYGLDASFSFDAVILRRTL